MWCGNFLVAKINIHKMLVMIEFLLAKIVVWKFLLAKINIYKMFVMIT